jgi:hypothetical protein
MQGSVDEFRIYNGALSANEIAATQALGPNLVLSVASPALSVSLSSTQLTLSWPAAAAGFTLQSCTNLGSGAWATVSPSAQMVGAQWQVTVPASGDAQFFRLAQ